MSKTAKQIGKCVGWTGDARVYELSEPLGGFKNVIVSATTVMFTGQPETYIFGAKKAEKKDQDGNEWVCADWGELDGSYQGGLSHAEALDGAGYEIVG